MIIHKKQLTDCRGRRGMFIRRWKISVSMKAIAIRPMLDGLHETVLVLLDLTGKCSYSSKTLLQGCGDEVGKEAENNINFT